MNIQAIFDAVQSHALATGLFDRVNTAEPKAAPGTGLTCSIWFSSIAPVPRRSGLAATSARLALSVRVYGSMLAEPADAIDPALVTVVDALITAYQGDFDLNGTVAEVDVLGAYGEGLTGTGGYLEIDGKLMRVVTINLPVIVNDAYTQTE